MSRSGFWFLVVGTSAALTHWVVLALSQTYMVAELANALGFVVAFWVSFGGHRWLSFRDARTSVPQSLLRFGVTSLAGFATNEFVFSALLRLLEFPLGLAWFLAAASAAAQTFVLSRFWAFRA